MARPARKGGKRSAAKARKAKGRSLGKTKRPLRPLPTKPPTASARGRSETSHNGRASRLARELREALAQQSATSDVLQVINNSPGDLGPVFDAIVDKALQICDARFGGLWIVDGELAHTVAARNVPKPYRDFLADQPFSLVEAFGRDIQDKPFSHVADLAATQSYRRQLPLATASVELGGIRTYLAIPLRDRGTFTGVLSVYRKEVRPFSARQILLLQGFAVQAEIAMKNARLFNEVQAKTRDLQESLQQQTATADVLKVISRSTFDLDTVMDTLARSALDLCGARTSALSLREGDMLMFRGVAALVPVDREFMKSAVPLNDNSHMGRSVLTGTVANIPDFINSKTKLRRFQEVRGFRSFLAVPLMREGQGIGVFTLTRDEIGGFSEREVELVQSFADQAVIAIENTRLFNETREALARQTATSDVLKVIASSPSNLQPVFGAIAERSKALIGGHSTTVVRYVGGIVELASFTPVSPEADATLLALFPMRPDTEPQFAPILRGEIALIVDAQSELQNTAMRDSARARGWRSRLLVPLKDDTGVIGWISITRKEPGGFAEKDVELLQTFADQAVIAIKNVELFEEVQAKTRDLEESLEQQTATSEVLEVISSSPGELEPVFRKMLENATRVCGANFGTMNLWDGNQFNLVADHNVPLEFATMRQVTPINPHPDTPMAAVLQRLTNSSMSPI